DDNAIHQNFSRKPRNINNTPIVQKFGEVTTNVGGFRAIRRAKLD
ncbi:MAG: hypothetical protein RLZZ382_2194, partial [Bacteroidota bacterium]